MDYTYFIKVRKIQENSNPVRVDDRLAKDVEENARKVLAIAKRGSKVVFPDIFSIYDELRRDLSRSVFAKQCAISIDKQQKEHYNNIVIDNDVII